MDILDILYIFEIFKTGVVITEISEKIQNSICEIGERIDEFEVLVFHTHLDFHYIKSKKARFSCI